MIFNTPDGKTVFACSRGGNVSKETVERMVGPLEKAKMILVPCATMNHPGCGGSGCECECHDQCKHLGLADWVDGFGWKCQDCGGWSPNHGGAPGAAGPDSNCVGAKGQGAYE